MASFSSVGSSGTLPLSCLRSTLNFWAPRRVAHWFAKPGSDGFPAPDYFRPALVVWILVFSLFRRGNRPSLVAVFGSGRGPMLFPLVFLPGTIRERVLFQLFPVATGPGPQRGARRVRQLVFSASFRSVSLRHLLILFRVRGPLIAQHGKGPPHQLVGHSDQGKRACLEGNRLICAGVFILSDRQSPGPKNVVCPSQASSFVAFAGPQNRSGLGLQDTDEILGFDIGVILPLLRLG